MKGILQLLLLVTTAMLSMAAGEIRVLIITGQNNHNWKATTPEIRKILEETGRFTVEVSERPETLQAEDFAKHQVILSNWNSFGQPAPGREKVTAWPAATREAYVNFVRNGGGHVVVHAGSCSFYDWKDYHAISLATWKVGQTMHYRPHEFKVRCVDADHPITRGLPDFRHFGELWCGSELHTDSCAVTEAFLDSSQGPKHDDTWTGSSFVGEFGKGRCFTTLLGHSVAFMKNPSFRSLLARGTEWTATGKVTIPAASAEIGIAAPGEGRLAGLGARELQRYIYLRTGILPAIQAPDAANPQVVLGLKGPKFDTLDDRVAELGPQEYLLKTVTESGTRRVHVIGGDPRGLLYGSYRLAEHLGVRFHLDGDVVPDRQVAWQVPELDELGKPLFALRGILPFHDFPEGPDWWEADDYMAYFSQMAKMRMNFIGLHCYPETRRENENSPAEPLIWLGLAEDVNEDGSVKHSYESYWANTSASGKWGYGRTRTSEFAAGGGLLFERDYHGHSLFEEMPPRPVAESGYTEYQPETASAEERECYNRIFNRAGRMLNEIFRFGHALGIRNAIGTQAPLQIPALLHQRLQEKGENFHHPDNETLRKVYEGTFARIAKAYPIDYYWLWTHEGWLGIGHEEAIVRQAVADKLTAREALRNIGDPFKLATSGWVLGPRGDRGLFDRELPKDMAMSCINTHIGFGPVEPAFAGIEGRGKWAIPWLEDDAAMIAPQLWAGRVRRDAADAHAYGCDGLMGIHWRTRVLSPNLAALAQAGWSQEGWNKSGELAGTKRDVRIGGRAVSFPLDAVEGSDPEPSMASQRVGMEAYELEVPNGSYTVKLQFCELTHSAPDRRVFSVRVNGVEVEKALDLVRRAGPAKPLILEYPEIKIGNERVKIEFSATKGEAILSGIVIDGQRAAHNQLEGGAYLRAINCGGGAVGDYEADLLAATVAHGAERPRDLPVDDFYQDWCRTQFGEAVVRETAAIFTRLDGGAGDYSHGKDQRRKLVNLPHPSTWTGGPGAIEVFTSDWDAERQRYAFVGELAALRSRVQGAGNLERFDYWLNTFRYAALLGELGCVRKQLDEVMEAVSRAQPDEASALARETALPLRLRLARLWEDTVSTLLATVSTPGEMGTLANLEQHVRRNARLPEHRFLDRHDARLTGLLESLPPEIRPTTTYRGPARIVVPTKRTLLERSNNDYRFKVIVLDAGTPQKVTLHWRVLGTEEFKELPLHLKNRRSYEAALPTGAAQTLEYFLSASTSDGSRIVWPPTAPGMNQTVIVQ